jgi:hypothetical protein
MAKRRVESQTANLTSDWQFDSWSLKVKNPPDFLACRWCAAYCRKDLDKGYNFALDLISIRGLHTKIWAPKVVGSQFREFRDSNLGVSGQNDIWVLALWPGLKNTIRGKVLDSPKSGLWWVLSICVCSSFVCAPKMPQPH